MSTRRTYLPRLSIVGMARPDAPPELGLALSQARAVRVRSHLLGLLSELSELSELSSCQWQEEEAMDCGVRALVDLGGSCWILVDLGYMGMC
jgi:hypothetical protein